MYDAVPTHPRQLRPTRSCMPSAWRASPGPTRRRTWTGCAARCASSTRSPSWARAAVGAAAHRGLRPRPGRADRQPGGADGAGRPEGHLPQRLAGGGRRQHGRPDVPGPEPLPGATACPTWCARINNALQRADQIDHAEGKDGERLLVRARSSPTPRPASAARSTPSS